MKLIDADVLKSCFEDNAGSFTPMDIRTVIDAQPEYTIPVATLHEIKTDYNTESGFRPWP